MTRARRTTTPTVPLAERIRAALAQGWHTLAALDDLTGLRGSKARAAVHEALREIKASGAVIEDGMALGDVAVRLAETAEQKEQDRATRDSDGDRPGGGVCVGDEAATREAVANEPSVPGAGAHPVAPQGDAPQAVGIALGSATSQGVVVSEPGPSSHCAVCEVVYAQHGGDRGHPFAPKPRGRPRAKQRKTPGPIVDVDGGRVERAGDAEPVEPVSPTPAGPGSLDRALRAAFPQAFEPEIIDGCDVDKVAREMVDLTVAFSPVVVRRDSIDAVDATLLDDGRYRVDECWHLTGLPIDVDAKALAVMRARYLLLRGVLTRSLAGMERDVRAAVVRRFFHGVEPWCPAPGSPLATMGAGPITMKIPDGVGIEGIDWTALMGALAGEGGTVPETVPVRPLGPPPPPEPPPEPPAAHVIEGEHSRACGYWKVHEPARLDPTKMSADIKLCRACWAKVYALGGGRPQPEDRRRYVGDRYV